MFDVENYDTYLVEDTYIINLTYKDIDPNVFIDKISDIIPPLKTLQNKGGRYWANYFYELMKKYNSDYSTDRFTITFNKHAIAYGNEQIEIREEFKKFKLYNILNQFKHDTDNLILSILMES